MGKRVLAMLLALLMTAGAFAGCAKDTDVALTLSFSGEGVAADGERISVAYSGAVREYTVTAADGAGTVSDAAVAVTYQAAGAAEWTSVQPISVGNHKIKAEVTAAGYTGSKEIPFVITKREVILTAAATTIGVNQVAGFDALAQMGFNRGALPANAAVSVTYRAGGDGEFTQTVPSNPGKYTVRFTAEDQFYSGTCEAELTVNATAQADGLSIGVNNHIYDGTEKEITLVGFNAEAMPWYGAPQILYDGAATKPVNIGDYAVSVTIPSAVGVDAVTLTGTLTVQKRAVTVTVQSRTFEVGETVTHDVSFGGDTVIKETDLIFEYAGTGETIYEKTTIVPSAAGVYEVTIGAGPNFIINGGDNVTAVYTVETRTGKGVEWSNLEQVFGAAEPVVYELKPYQNFVSIEVTGTANDGTAVSLLYDERDHDPILIERAGNYQIKLKIETDGEEETLTETLTVQKKSISFTAENKEFYTDNIPSEIEHVLTVSGGEMPSYSVEYLLNSEPVSLTAGAEPGNYTAVFTVTDADNYAQPNPVTAQYTVSKRPVPELSTASVPYNGEARAASLTGLSSSILFDGALLYYERGADENTAVAEAPVNAGDYTVKAVVSYALDDLQKTYTYDYTVGKKAVTLTVQPRQITPAETFTHDFSFDQTGALPSKANVTVSYQGINGTVYGPSVTPPDAVGEYLVTVSVDETKEPNFTGFGTAEYEITARAGGALNWNGLLTRVYGDNTPLTPDLAEHQTVEGAWTFTGIGGTVYPESGVQPVEAGTYQIKILIASDGIPEEDSRLVTFTIHPKEVELSAADRSFEVGETITHSVTAIGGDIPSFSVSYTDEGGEPVDGAPETEGIYTVAFTLADTRNYVLVNAPVTAVYRLIGDRPDSFGLEDNSFEFSNTAPVLAVTGLDGYQSAVVARHYAAGGYTSGGENTPLASAPVNVGAYKAEFDITDRLTGETANRVFDYEITKKALTITPDDLNVSCTASAIRPHPASGSGNVRFSITGTVPGAAIENGVNAGQTGDIVFVTLTYIEDADGNPVAEQSAKYWMVGPVKASDAQAAIPANSPAGKYKAVFTVEHESYTGSAEITYTLTPRNPGALTPSGLTAVYGEPVNVGVTFQAANGTTRSNQAWIDGSVFCYEGTGETVYTLTETAPTDRGTYTVTRLYSSDGVTKTWLGTLTIGKKAIQFTPQNQTTPYHLLDGAPYPDLDSLGIPDSLNDLQKSALTYEDFEILYYAYVDGAVPTDAVGTSAVPVTAGKYRVDFTLSDSSNFSGSASAVYEITARTGDVLMPLHSYAFPTGSGITLTPGNLQDYHTERSTTYELLTGGTLGGDNAEWGVPTENLPIADGVYRVTFTCVTDTVTEEYVGYLYISENVNTLLPVSAVYDPDGVSPEFLPSIAWADADKFVEYTFTYGLDDGVTREPITVRIDGSSLDKIPLLPGEYDYTVAGTGIDVSDASGKITVVFGTALDAYEYASKKLDETESWASVYSGHTAAPMSTITYTYTYRYKNNPADQANKFFYQTMNAGPNAFGVLTRMGLQSYVRTEQTNWIARFTESDDERHYVSQSNPVANWASFDKIAEKPYTPAEYAGHFGFTPDGLTGYIVNASTVETGNTNVSLNANSQYNISFTLNAGSHINAGVQIDRYSFQQFRAFGNLRLSFTLDMYGRARFLDTVDTYSVTGGNSTHIGKEEFIYGVPFPTLDPTTHTWKDPRPGETGTIPGQTTTDDVGGGGECVAEGTLITLADGSQVPVEQLTGGELLLVWNLETGTFDAAPIVFNASFERKEYEVVCLYFSDGTEVKVIGEHAFWDFDLNEYVFVGTESGAEEYIGHRFQKLTADINGNSSWEAVRLVDVKTRSEVTTPWSPVTARHLCYYVNGVLSMPGGTTGLINIFEVDPETMRYNQDALAADIETYGIYTYEEFAEMFPIPETVFDAFGARYFKVSLGKGLITLDEIGKLIETYAKFLGM